MDIGTIGGFFPYGLVVIWAAVFIVFKVGKLDMKYIIPGLLLPTIFYLMAILMLTSFVNPINSPQVVRYIYDNGTAILNNGTAIRFQVLP